MLEDEVHVEVLLDRGSVELHPVVCRDPLGLVAGELGLGDEVDLVLDEHQRDVAALLHNLPPPLPHCHQRVSASERVSRRLELWLI